MKQNQFLQIIAPTPSKTFFVGLIVLGWGFMLMHPVHTMVHHHPQMDRMPSDFAKALTMWVAMVLAMMVPTLIPLFKTGDSRALGFARVLKFICGYVLAWAGFCIAATLLQYGLRSTTLINMQNVSTSDWFSAVLLGTAGFFQLTRAK